MTLCRTKPIGEWKPRPAPLPEPKEDADDQRVPPAIRETRKMTRRRETAEVVTPYFDISLLERPIDS